MRGREGGRDRRSNRGRTFTTKTDAPYLSQYGRDCLQHHQESRVMSSLVKEGGHHLKRQDILQGKGQKMYREKRNLGGREGEEGYSESETAPPLLLEDHLVLCNDG